MFVFLGFALLSVAVAKPHVADLQVSLEAGSLEVSFDLVEVLEPTVIERIDAGLPTGFDITVKLVKGQKWWTDKTLQAEKLRVEARYDAVAGEYLVNFRHNDKLVESRVVREPEDLNRALTHFERLKLFNLAEIDSEKPVTVRVRAELGSRHWLYLIPMTRKTDWAESRKLRLPGSLE